MDRAIPEGVALLEARFDGGGAARVDLGKGAVLHILGRNAGAERPSNTVFLDQVHGAEVVFEALGGEKADGAIQARQGPFPGLSVADCLPLFMLSDSHIGAVHAGWRGLAGGIAGRLAEMMPGAPELVVMGPCICGRCYEVGPEVIREVLSTCGTRIGHLPGRLDLRRAALDHMRRRGLPRSCPVLAVGDCTLCGGDNLYSYRGGDQGGRNLVWLEPSGHGC